MKNREKFAKEIIDIAYKGDSFSVTKSSEITFCDRFKCDMCKFNDSTGEKSCRTKRYEWSESEYIEKPTITSREKNFLDAILPNFKYIARDFNDNLCIYYNKPKRNSMDNYWIPDDEDNDRYYYVSSNMYGNMFDFIKWEDEEPWLIEDLKKLECEEYETD